MVKGEKGGKEGRGGGVTQLLGRLYEHNIPFILETSNWLAFVLILLFIVRLFKRLWICKYEIRSFSLRVGIGLGDPLSDFV
jgi:hypothetical protein